MKSLAPRPGARGLVASGIVAAGLILDPGGLISLGTQEPPAKGAASKEKPPAASTPDVQLRVQRLRTRKARAAYDVARLNREIAEIAVEEYQQGTYALELATVEGELKLAESDLIRAEDRLDWARRMFEKKFVTKATRVSEELNLEKSKYTLEQARARRDLLVKYPSPKTIETLRADVEKARLVEIDREAEWEREAARQAELERRLDRT